MCLYPFPNSFKMHNAVQNAVLKNQELNIERISNASFMTYQVFLGFLWQIVLHMILIKLSVYRETMRMQGMAEGRRIFFKRQTQNCNREKRAVHSRIMASIPHTKMTQFILIGDYRVKGHFLLYNTLDFHECVFL